MFDTTGFGLWKHYKSGTFEMEKITEKIFQKSLWEDWKVRNYMDFVWHYQREKAGSDVGGVPMPLDKRIVILRSYDR